MKPSEVTKGHVERRLWWHQYKPKESYEKSKQLHKVSFAFKKGNHVCICHKVQILQWGHDKKRTREIFEVYQPFMCLGVCKYHLHDLQGEGTFEVEREFNHRG